MCWKQTRSVSRILLLLDQLFLPLRKFNTVKYCILLNIDGVKWKFDKSKINLTSYFVLFKMKFHPHLSSTFFWISNSFKWISMDTKLFIFHVFIWIDTTIFLHILLSFYSFLNWVNFYLIVCFFTRSIHFLFTRCTWQFFPSKKWIHVGFKVVKKAETNIWRGKIQTVTAAISDVKSAHQMFVTRAERDNGKEI